MTKNRFGASAVCVLALALMVLFLQAQDDRGKAELNAPGGKQVKLADLLGKGPIVLYTFIGAFNGP